MRKPRRLTKNSKFKITGYVGGQAYTGRRGRKNYYNKPSDMQSIPHYQRKRKAAWSKFLQSGLVEDCPHCNPEILFMYRLNPEHDPVVETNFEMTMEIRPVKQRRNYLKNKAQYKTCKNHPVYDHHHHKYNSFNGEHSMSRKNSLYGSITPDKVQSFIQKYGRSINQKIKFKKNLSKSSLLDTRLYKKKKYGGTKNKKKPSSYSRLYKEKSERSYRRK